MVKLLLTCCALLIAAPAYACGVLESAEPKVGSEVSHVQRVSAYFTQEIVPQQSHLKIIDEAGKLVRLSANQGAPDDKKLTVGTATLAPGKYKVTWNVLWKDCDSKSSGSYKFTVLP